MSAVGELSDSHAPDVTGQRAEDDGLQGLLATLEAEMHGVVDDYYVIERSGNITGLVQAHLARLPGLFERVRLCDRLASSLWKRWKRDGTQMTLVACVDVRRELLNMHPPSDANRSGRCNALGYALRMLFEEVGHEELILAAIELHREAHTLRPVGHSGRHQTCSDLAIALYNQFQQTRDRALLDEVLGLHREALHLRSPDHPYRHYSCNNLAMSLHSLFQLTGDKSRLEEAIQFYRETLLLRQQGHPHRYNSCSNLATALHDYLQHGGDGALLDEIIQLHREALALRPQHYSKPHAILNNLALALCTRYAQTGDGGVLDEAVYFARSALAMLPAGHAERHMLCNNLALLLQMYFDFNGDRTLLDDAIRYSREALSLRPLGHPDRDMSCNNLANSLNVCFYETKDKALLDEAIQLHREALSLQSPINPHRPWSCFNLASDLLQCATQSPGDDTLYTEAYTLLGEAQSLTSPEHPVRWYCTMQRALLASIQRHTHPAAVEFLQEMLSGADSHHIAHLPKLACSIMMQIDLDAISNTHAQSLLRSCGRALDFVAASAEFGFNPQSQLGRVSDAMTIAIRAYTLAIRVDGLPVGLQLLERARGMVWAQNLHMRNPQIDRLPPDLAHTFADLVRAVNASRSSSANHLLAQNQIFVSQQDSMYAQRSQMQYVLREIRALPGLDDFMRGPDSQALLAAATRHPVVVLVASKKECYALVVRSPAEPPTNILLAIEKKTLQNLTLGNGTSHQRGSLHEDQRAMGVAKINSASQTVLAKLWRLVVKPVFDYLQLVKMPDRQRPRLYWCPTGAFAFTPLHAAGIYKGRNRECCSDYVVSSYAPTLTALLRAQQHTDVYTVPEMRLVTVTAEQALDTALPTLRYVAQETQQISEIAATVGMSLTQARAKGDVLASLSSTTIVHFACHGVQNDKDPHESHFCLGDGNLTISELMDADLGGAFFGFLSACETAKGDRDHADEVVHLAASMLFAGFKSVIATMWAMNDRDGPIVTRRFYQQLLGNNSVDVDAIPYALDSAVIALRESGAPPERWATFIHMGA